MSTKSRVTEKGDMWEWEHTPEVEEALKVLHNTERKHAEDGGDYGVGK